MNLYQRQGHRKALKKQPFCKKEEAGPGRGAVACAQSERKKKETESYFPTNERGGADSVHPNAAGSMPIKNSVKERGASLKPEEKEI